MANYASVSGTEKLRPKGTSARKVYIEARATSSQNENRPVKEKPHIDLLGSTLY